MPDSTDMKLPQCRVFLETPEKKFKKIYSIRAYRNKRGEGFIQTQIWSTLMCDQYEIPSDSEIHHQCPSNGKDLHLSIKYIDPGPFEDKRITEIENFLTIYPSRDLYKHKQVIQKKGQILDKKEHYLPLSKEMRIRFLLGYIPDSFDRYRNNESNYPIYYFPTLGTPILPLSSQKLKGVPSENGDKYKTLPKDNDIVIQESYAQDTRINVCGFICEPGYRSDEEDAKKKNKSDKRLYLARLRHQRNIFLACNMYNHKNQIALRQKCPLRESSYQNRS